MKIKVSLSVGNEYVKEDWIELEDGKLEELSDEEREAAVEVVVRRWADRLLSVAWETEEEKEA